MPPITFFIGIALWAGFIYFIAKPWLGGPR